MLGKQRNAILKQERIRKVNNPEVLILSTKYDYSTDYICIELEKRKIPFLRINRDMFSSYKMLIDLQNKKLDIVFNNSRFTVTSATLMAVYYRAPVFLRNSKPYSVEEQLARGQWSAFIRNLIIFDKAKWVNHPVKTYQAENKLFQLQVAKEVGLEVPYTLCGNMIPTELSDDMYVIKSLDTALFYDNGTEMFTYSSIIEQAELKVAQISEAPVIIQQLIQNKTDIRVTYVGGHMYPVSIEDNQGGIVGDWRKTPREVLHYTSISIPETVKGMLQSLMNKLELNFGGIDLALSDGKYYFIEVNPTGEWGWLKKTTGCPIDVAIVDILEG